MDRQRRGLGGSIELGVYYFLFSLFLYETIEDVWNLWLGTSLTESFLVLLWTSAVNSVFAEYTDTFTDVHNAFRKLSVTKASSLQIYERPSPTPPGPRSPISDRRRPKLCIRPKSRALRR